MIDGKSDTINDIGTILSGKSLADVKKIPQEEIRLYSNLRGLTALHCAVRNSDVEVVKYLLNDIKLSPNVIATNNTKPIITAASLGKMDVIKLLIYSGSEYECKDITGRTVRELLNSRGKNLEVEFDNIVNAYKADKETQTSSNNEKQEQLPWLRQRKKPNDDKRPVESLNDGRDTKQTGLPRCTLTTK